MGIYCTAINDIFQGNAPVTAIVIYANLYSIAVNNSVCQAFH